MPLTEQHRAKLDSIVSQMQANQEPEDNIRFVVEDFKSKYEGDVPRGESKSREQLLAEHQANVAAGEAAYKPGYAETFRTRGLGGVGEELAKGAVEGITKTPERIGGMIQGLTQGAAGLVDPSRYKSIAENPIVDLPGQLGAGLVTGLTEPLISPRTTGESATGAVIDVAATAGIGKTLGLAATKLGPAAGRRIVQSIIKPVKGELQFGKDPVGAVLGEKIVGNSLDDYLKNVSGRKAELMSGVESQLASSTKTVGINEITSLLDNEMGRLKRSVGITNKDALMGRIETLQAEILDRYPNKQLTLPEVHALRREIDDTIPRFTSEAIEQEANKYKYQFRSGLNRLIEDRAPGVKQANRRVSELIDVENALNRRILQAGNAPVGQGATTLGTIGGLAGAAIGGPAGVIPGSLGGAAAGMAKNLLGSTAAKTRAARALNRFGKKDRVTLKQAMQTDPDIAPVLSELPLPQRGLGAALAALSAQPRPEPFRGDLRRLEGGEY